MENQIKIKLLILVVVMHFVTLYFDLKLHWTNAANEKSVSTMDLTELLCKRSTNENTCDSTWYTLRHLTENCGRTIINWANQDLEKEEIAQLNEPSKQKITLVHSSQDREKPVRQEKNIVYHILFVLLVTSATASIVDFFQEKSRRKALGSYNSSTPTSGSKGDAPLNRRISLAELTMQRHARRESQAGYRPSDSQDKTQPAATVRRNSSVARECDKGGGGMKRDNQLNKCRQKSWPSALLRRWSRSDRVDSVGQLPSIDGGWAERRRVRMIQRH